MDYEQEFAALWKAVDDEKEAMYVETTDEMMEYILRFSDMERFLKEAYEEGQRRGASGSSTSASRKRISGT